MVTALIAYPAIGGGLDFPKRNYAGATYPSFNNRETSSLQIIELARTGVLSRALAGY